MIYIQELKKPNDGHSAIGFGSDNSNQMLDENFMCLVGIVEIYNITSSTSVFRIHAGVPQGYSSGVNTYDVYLQNVHMIPDPVIENVGAMIVF